MIANVLLILTAILVLPVLIVLMGFVCFYISLYFATLLVYLLGVIEVNDEDS